MAQTTGGLSWVDAEIEFSSDGGSTWSDISGFTNSLEVSGGERVTGAAYTADGDTAVITRGKRQPLTITVNALWTDLATDDPRPLYQTAYESATGDVRFRWSPEGGDATEVQYTSSAGIPITPVYMGGASDSGDPIMITMTIECASITEGNAS